MGSSLYWHLVPCILVPGYLGTLVPLHPGILLPCYPGSEDFMGSLDILISGSWVLWVARLVLDAPVQGS